MSPKKISRPIGNDAEELEHPIITGFTPIASYNWLDDPDPTTLVTGMSFPHPHSQTIT